MGCTCLFQFWFPPGICLGVGLLGHMVVLFPVFLRNLYTVFHSDCINLHSHQQCKRVPFPPYPLQHLLFLHFFWWWSFWPVWGDYYLMVLFCISLITSDVEHLFMCLLAICMRALEKCLFRSFCHFLIGLFVFLALSCISCLYILEIILCQLFHLLLSSPILRVIFLTLLIVFFAVPKLSS